MMRPTSKPVWPAARPAFLSSPAKFVLGFSLGLALLLSAPSAGAQKKDAEPALRNVHGVVEDKNETPVGSAVVYLKDNRSLTVKTYISEDNGQYHFSGLDPNSDYEVHAETADLMSNTRTVSSFDTRKDFEVTLKLDKKKAAR
jgi:Carboxypeptidase regulatory-like domain